MTDRRDDLPWTPEHLTEQERWFLLGQPNLRHLPTEEERLAAAMKEFDRQDVEMAIALFG